MNPITLSTQNPIDSIGAVLQSTLVTKKVHQIPYLVNSVTRFVESKQGKYYIENFWSDPKALSSACVGIRITIRMPIRPRWPQEWPQEYPQEPAIEPQKYMLMEVQIHVQEIMKQMEECGEGIRDLFYKSPQELRGRELSSEIIRGVQLVYLIAMLKLSCNKEKWDKIIANIKLGPSMHQCDNQMRAAIAAAKLLKNLHFKAVVWRDVKWNEKHRILVPKTEWASLLISKIWEQRAREINQNIHLRLAPKDQKNEWTNTATTIDQLYEDARLMFGFFHSMCDEAVEVRKGTCCVSYAPRYGGFMVKGPESLEAKMAVIYSKKERRCHGPSVTPALPNEKPFLLEQKTSPPLSLVQLNLQKPIHYRRWITPDDQLRRLTRNPLELRLYEAVTHWSLALTHLIARCPRMKPESIPPLPENIFTILKSDCPIFEGKKIYETHVLSLISEEFGTINQLEKTFLSQTPSQYFCQADRETYGDRPFGPTYWVLSTKTLYSESKDVRWHHQMSHLHEFSRKAQTFYTPPTLQEALAISLTYEAATGKTLYGVGADDGICTHCWEKSDRRHMVYGGYRPYGIYVTPSSSYDFTRVGITPVRYLTPLRSFML